MFKIVGYKYTQYKFNRLPFGLKVSPSIFQQIMDTMLAGLDFTTAYLNDRQILNILFKFLKELKNMDSNLERKNVNFSWVKLSIWGR